MLTCPPPFYPDSPSSSCRRCDAGCRACTGPSRCTQCADNNTLISGVCSSPCGANCLACANNLCTACAVGTSWNGVNCAQLCPSGATPVNGVCVCPGGQALFAGVCVSVCPTGLANVNGECRACTAPCLTCSNSVERCDTCVTGFTLDQVNRRCVQNTNCDFGQYRSTFNDCRFICPEGSFFLDSACYVTRCPVGFSANVNRRICVRD